MKSIKEQRVESLLLELLSEALTSLSDTRINHLSITEVVCSRGKYNAEVYVLFDGQDKEEQRQLLKILQKAEGVLREYVLSASGWFKCPRFTFKSDESLERANQLDQIFAKIHE
ncbi:30S ribosome-binding factor RbfA [Helicobacter mustelae]|uniref:Ribosome-binding factor A n=1 Tax=Helicobacter mustelae (strain ATCC 43772 / CCUG 25715 / CIP 103759 / LMG 18044 / NCTC 12198 / R85-136P) TaxID=679897 RepID=D3UG19_HELM1|nr:30S ribosome-binding factor RbfA [Helicobacter mustelae]CBG39440.1 Putative ribosome-binding factor A [Helicobacter mustelae 12198]SQH70952.1 ribosome-binding factor A [Helicobacter mustelae]STP12078.1 ribosome-binding factor A [Helicobacter mustelae]